MPAYPKSELYNLYVSSEALLALEDETITPQEFDAIKNAYPVTVYTPRTMVAIGLGILTVIIVLLTAGLFLLVFGGIDLLAGVIIFFGLSCYAALEIMVAKKHYNSGVDNILMVATVCFIVGGIAASLKLTSDYSDAIVISIVACTLCLILVMRFCDSLMALVASGALLCAVFFCCLPLGIRGLQIFPFAMILTSALVYIVSNYLLRVSGAVYYKRPLFLVGAIGLITFYGLGNVYVINQLVPDFTTASTHFIPVVQGGFFWSWTFAIPLVYLYKGVRSKSQLFTRLGMVLMVAAVLTWYYYYPIVSGEVLMLISGIVLILVSYGLIKLIQPQRWGFIFHDRGANEQARGNVEGVIVSEAFGNNQPTPEETSFGGGSFGGGGAGDRY